MSPCVTQEVGSLQPWWWRVRLSGTAHNLSRLGKGEGVRQRNHGEREGSGKQHATLRVRRPLPLEHEPLPTSACVHAHHLHPTLLPTQKKKQFIVYVNYIILYYQYIYFLDYTTICYGVNVQVCASHDAAHDVREVVSKASLTVM